MRIARLVGLSQDGKSLIVATESGDELAVAVDERLHAALRGDRPRLGQLEIEMETSLSPRDIQTRIRAGSTLEDVAKVAGLPLDRVERFAAPVLAEREHIARLAMASSVRRRGETSGHRSLRLAVTERLGKRGIDLETVAWDSYRLSDGRWTVTADYRSGEARRHATFTFDASGRFSVAEDDEARWLLGEHLAHPGAAPGRRHPVTGESSDEADDTEPTLDLSDDLALVRAIREPPQVPIETRLAAVHDLHPDAAPDEDDLLDDMASDERLGNAVTESASTSATGLTDAMAVPDTSNLGWEPAIVVNYPVEPSLLDETDDADEVEPVAVVQTGEPGPPEPDLQEFGAVVPERADEHPVTGAVGSADPLHPPVVHQHHLRGTDEPGRPDPPTGIEDRTDEAKEFVEETLAKESHTEELVDKPAKKKRASVPSWDEIMFGGPRRG